MAKLDEKKCIPCEVGGIPLINSEINDYIKDLQGWKNIDDKRIEKEFKFKNFVLGMEFANKITEVAEDQGHHPSLTISWGKVLVTLFTHKINGLHENDFIMAAKIDKI